MYVGMGLVKNEHGVWCARQKVPVRLQEAVARALGKQGRGRQTFLKQSLRTKDKAEAKRRLSPVLIEFARIIRSAEAAISPDPVLPQRSTLSRHEIERLAHEMFAKLLGDDERLRFGGRKYRAELQARYARECEQDGVEPLPPMFPLESTPERGMSDAQFAVQRQHLADELPLMQEWLARGDTSAVKDDTDILLADAQINLDPQSDAYHELCIAVMQQYVRALKAIEQRNTGEVIETPKLAPRRSTSAGEGTLRVAFAGWQKKKEPSQGTLKEYERAVDLFIQLHGDMPVAEIRRTHAHTFLSALQDVPWPRSGVLAGLTLPEIVEWRKQNHDAPRLSRTSVNKQFGGVQAIVKLARNKLGMIPEEVWADPFSEMRLEEDDPEGGPFEQDELRNLFASGVFTRGERPEAGRGDVAFWLPVLGLFTGARRSELAMLLARDVEVDEATRRWTLAIYEDKAKSKTLKTKNSARTIPVHSELVRLGFLQFAAAARQAGKDAWLFPSIAPATSGGMKAWSKWFRRYLNGLGITDDRKGMHSLRHNFTDAMRTAGIPDDLVEALSGRSLPTVGRGYGARPTHKRQRHRVIVERYSMARLIETVDKVAYPSINLKAVRWLADDSSTQQR